MADGKSWPTEWDAQEEGKKNGDVISLIKATNNRRGGGGDGG